MLWLRTAVFTLLVRRIVLVLVQFGLAASRRGPRSDLSWGRFIGLATFAVGWAIIGSSNKCSEMDTERQLQWARQGRCRR